MLNSPAAFNIVAAVVMGALGLGALLLVPAASHDVCLAVVSGLTGALAGGAAAKITQSSGPGAVIQPDSPSPQPVAKE